MISVIVPIYKVEKYISECVESILSQTYKDFELILVDDGSPDESGKICDQLALSDSRIKVIHKKNGGVTLARKVGFDASIGNWICFVDGDDTLPKNSLEILLKESDGYDVVYGNLKPSRYLKYCENLKYENKECNSNSAIYDLFKVRMFTGLPCRIYKRYLFNEKVWDVDPVVKIAEDFIMLLRIFNEGKKFKMIDDVVYNYRIVETSVCNSKSSRSLYSIWLVFLYKIKALTFFQLARFFPNCFFSMLVSIMRLVKNKLM